MSDALPSGHDLSSRSSTRSDAFLAALRTGPVLCDGAMGTMLTVATSEGAAGGAARPVEYLVPEELNELNPERVLAVHRAYAAAGARVLETNSFGGSAIKLAAARLRDRAGDLNVRAAQLARQVADEGRRDAGTQGRRDAGTQGRRATEGGEFAASPIWVAGSIGPTGQFLEPLGELSFAAAREAFGAQAAALAAGGADLILIETMSDVEEARAALLGAKAATELPVLLTLTFESHGRTIMGLTPEDAARALADLGAAAIGTNCGQGPDTMLPVVQRLRAALPDVPLVAQANAGQPRLENGVVYYDCGPEAFAAYTQAYLDAGVHLLGSCCGSTPAHTAALAAALAAAAT